MLEKLITQLKAKLSKKSTSSSASDPDDEVDRVLEEELADEDDATGEVRLSFKDKMSLKLDEFKRSLLGHSLMAKFIKKNEDSDDEIENDIKPSKKAKQSKSKVSDPDKTNTAIDTNLEELEKELKELDREINEELDEDELLGVDAEDEDDGGEFEDDDEEDEDDEDGDLDELAKKKKKKIIYIAVGLLIAVLLYDEFFPSDEAKNNPEVAIGTGQVEKKPDPVVKPESKPEMKLETKVEPELAKPADLETEDKIVPDQIDEPTPEVISEKSPPPITQIEDQVSQENDFDSDDESDQAEEATIKEPVKTTVEAADADVDEDEDDDEAIEPQPKLPSAPESKQVRDDLVVQDAIENNIDQADELFEDDFLAAQPDLVQPMTGEFDNQTPQVGDGISEEILKNLEKQIQSRVEKRDQTITLQKEASFDTLGRGLVYSCNGKHWACVDSLNYNRCENNFKYYSFNNQKPACFPEQVYLTEKDCALAQQRMIDYAIPASFCD